MKLSKCSRRQYHVYLNKEQWLIFRTSEHAPSVWSACETNWNSLFINPHVLSILPNQIPLSFNGHFHLKAWEHEQQGYFLWLYFFSWNGVVILKQMNISYKHFFTFKIIRGSELSCPDLFARIFMQHPSSSIVASKQRGDNFEPFEERWFLLDNHYDKSSADYCN